MLHAEGPLCSIDLTERSFTTETIDDVTAEFIGGRGVATKLATDRLGTDTDPLSPENRVFFTTGPMQLSTTSFTGRMNATSLSPLTDGLLSSNAGGFLSRNFAGTGNCAVELRGAADELLAVHVREDGVEFEAVPELEGAEVPEVTEWAEAQDLSKEHVVCIGPGGENEVRFASLMTTEERAFGRGGLGAVLGSKNVKLLTFDGDAAPDLELPEGAMDDAMDVHREAATSDSIMKRQGTSSMVDFANNVGTFPTRYFEDVRFDRYESINGDRVEEKKYKKGTCSQCAFACKLPTRDEATGLETEGPEFETVMAFGGNCEVDDIVAVMKSNELCDRYGLDTISCGDTIAAYLKSEDEFGNVELIHELVEKIAHREGVGDLLAEGTHRVHDELGVDDWTVKGMEFPAHDGRTLHGQGLSFAMANRGADHMYATFYAWEYPLVSKEEAYPPEGLNEEKVEQVVKQENTRALEDCGIVCRFSRDVMTEARFEAFFGEDIETLRAVGAKTIDMERAFNNARGFDSADDTLPYDLPDFEAMRSYYYDVRGWSDDGQADVGADGGTAATADD
mgnify:CR=1 FL=1